MAATSPSTFRQATVLTASYHPTVSDASYCASLRSSPKIIGITQLSSVQHPLHQLPSRSHRSDRRLGYPYIPQTFLRSEVVGAKNKNFVLPTVVIIAKVFLPALTELYPSTERFKVIIIAVTALTTCITKSLYHH